MPVIRHRYIYLAITLVLLALMYRETSATILSSWSKDPLGHGYLVLPAALYWAWRQRHFVASAQTAPAFWWLPLLGIVAFAWLVGNLSNAIVVQQICLVLMFIGLVWGTLGTSGARSLFFAFGLLIFALPFADWVVPALQESTARLAVMLLQITGVPALLQGLVVAIPGSRWEVAEACSGINYLMSSLLLGYLYAGLVYRTWPHRIGFFLASGIVALFANGLRVYFTILAASFGAASVADGMRHYAVGWIVFAIIAWITIMTCGHWREDEPATDLAVQGIQEPRLASARLHRAPIAFLVAAVLILATAPLAARQLWVASDGAGPTAPASVEVADPWEGVARDLYPEVPRFLGPSAEFLRTFQSAGHNVRLDVAHYRGPDARHGMPARTVPATSSADTRIESSRRRRITLDGQSFDVQESILLSSRSALVVWTWYAVDGVYASGWYRTKLMLAKSRLLGSAGGAAAFTLSTPHQEEDRGVAILEDFVAHLTLAVQ